MSNIIILYENVDEYRKLKYLIDTTLLDMNVIGLTSYEEVFVYLKEKKIDFIYIEDHKIDIALIKRITFNSYTVKIIFFGTKDNYSLSLYETSHIYYLVKPITKESLLKAHRKGVFEISKGMNENLILELKRNILTISTKDIIYIMSEGRYITIYGTSIDHRFIEKLDNIELKLPQYFYRVHQSFIININEVKSLNANSCIIGDERIRIPISRGRFQGLKNAVLNTMISCIK